MKREPKIDEYIARSEDFAKPILHHLREIIHDVCPGVEEKMKWSFPHFDYKGPFLSMAAFKHHCAFTFWKADLINDPDGVLDKNRTEGMGHFGKITQLSDLPPDNVLSDLIRKAMHLNDEGIKLPSKSVASKKKVLEIPEWFMIALKSNKKAYEAFENFSYSHKKEYLDWITEAKREETRQKRLQQAILLISEGKNRNWKYEK